MNKHGLMIDTKTGRPVSAQAATEMIERGAKGGRFIPAYPLDAKEVGTLARYLKTRKNRKKKRRGKRR